MGRSGPDRGKICHYSYKRNWICGSISNDNADPKNCFRISIPKKVVPLPKLGVQTNITMAGFSSGAFKTALIFNGFP
jgi:hypothetical protein